MNIIAEKAEARKGFFGKIKDEVKVLSNISYILEKIEHDGFMRLIRDSFEKVISHEIVFALSELSKIEKKSEKEFDMKNQLTNNTFIFKENLKIIVGFTSEVISRPDLEGRGEARCFRASGSPHTGGEPEGQHRRDQRGRGESDLLG
jgi:hypothetical protein